MWRLGEKQHKEDGYHSSERKALKKYQEAHTSHSVIIGKDVPTWSGGRCPSTSQERPPRALNGSDGKGQAMSQMTAVLGILPVLGTEIGI